MFTKSRSLARLFASFSALIILGLPWEAWAVQDLGILGKVYPIAERDMEEFLKEKAALIDSESYKSQLAAQAQRSYCPDFRIPNADQKVVRHIDPSIRVTQDIKDHQGKTLVPKGTLVNPLDSMLLMKTYLVINGKDKEQVDFARKCKDPKVILLTQGNPFQIGKELKRNVYIATMPVLQRFEIGHVPAIIQQEGKFIRVEEIPTH